MSRPRTKLYTDYDAKLANWLKAKIPNQRMLARAIRVSPPVLNEILNGICGCSLVVAKRIVARVAGTTLERMPLSALARRQLKGLRAQQRERS